MARLEPALDFYNCNQRLDGIPQDWKNEIDQFHRQRNVISPNKKYHATRQHPLYTRQTQTAPKIYRYETWNELWDHFQQDHADISTKIINPKNPHKCQGLLYHGALWKMVKCDDSSFLCTNCEGMNTLRRGSLVTKVAIEYISEQVKYSITSNTVNNISNNETVHDLEQINNIRDIICTLSKYYSCITCLKPCIASYKPEDTKHSCFTCQCNTCGFRIL